MLPPLQIGDYSWVLPYVPYPIVVFLFIFIFLNIEKVERWSAALTTAFSWASSRAEKASVARDIQGRISEFRRRSDYRDALPYRLKVRWEKGETVAQIKEGEVIVVMEEHKNQARNFLTAVTAYMAIGLFPNARPYCQPKLSTAIELVTEYKIVLQERTDALPMFKDEVLTPQTKADSELEGLVNKLEEFERAGVFSRIFLRELVKYGNELSGTIPSNSDWMPVNDLISMLYGMVTKPPGVEDGRPYSVNHEHLKFVIVRVASFHTLIRAGTDAHVNFARSHVTKGFTRFYVWVRGDREKEGKQVVSKMVKSGDFQLDMEDSYRVVGERANNYVAELHSLRPGTETSVLEDEANGRNMRKIHTLGTGRQVLISAIGRLDRSTKYIDESEIGRALLDEDPEFSTMSYGSKSLEKFLSLYPDVLIRTSSKRGTQFVYELVVERTQ